MNFIHTNISSASLKAYSFAKLFCILLFWAVATTGSALAELQQSTTRSELEAGELKAARLVFEDSVNLIAPIYVSGVVDSAYVDTENHVAWAVVDGVAQSWTFDLADAIDVKSNRKRWHADSSAVWLEFPQPLQATNRYYPIIINDENGNQYTIWPNGNVFVTTYLVVSDNWDINPNQVVQFAQAPDETFGFDPKEHIQWHAQYEIMQLKDSSKYFVSNKSMGTGVGDVVAFTPSVEGGTPNFELEDGTALTVSNGIIAIPAFASKGKKKIFAFNNAVRVGQLNVMVYDQKEKKVVLVPMGGAMPDTASIHAALKNTLGEANLKFTLTLAPQWNNDVFTTSKAIELPEEVGLLNKYSDDMRALREAYFNDPLVSTEEDAYYVFVVPGFSDASIDGYMVRGKALGFVKAGSDATTYAHELGHGIGALEHSWKPSGGSGSLGPAEGTTSNLMDYASAGSGITGGNLTLAQWKELRDFDVLPSMWDEAEDAQYTAKELDYIWLFINSELNSVFSDTEYGASLSKVSDGYDITIKTFDKRGYFEVKRLVSEMVVHIDNSQSREEMVNLLAQYGLTRNSSYDYYLFANEMEHTIERWANYQDHQLTEPPFAVQLLADVLMGIPGAVYGFATNENWRTGETLTGWDHVFNTLEIIPVAGAFTKTFKIGIKSLKVYKAGSGIVFDVVQAAKKINTKVFDKISTLQASGVRLAGDATDKMYLLYKTSAEKLAKVTEYGLSEIKKYLGSSNYEVVTDLGSMPVKIGDDFVEAEVKIVKNGNEVGVVVVNGAGSTGIKIIDDFLALAPKIDNISSSSIPTGYQIITKNGSKYIRRIDVSNPNTPRLMVDHTGTIVPYVKPQRLASNNLLRSRLKQANGGIIPDGHQAHHLVPDNVVQNSPIHQEAINRGLYDIDRVSNGKLLAETAEDYAPISEAFPTHFGSHPNYDAQVIDAMNDILDIHNVLPSQVGSLSDAKLLEIIDDIEGSAVDILTDWIPSKLN